MYPSETYSQTDPLRNGRSWGDLERRCFGNVGAELWGKLGKVVCEDRRIVAGAGDRDVAETRIHEVRVNPGIGVDEDAFGGEPLGTVAGHGVTMVEVAMFCRIEFDRATGIEASLDASIATAIRRNGVDYG